MTTLSDRIALAATAVRPARGAVFFALAALLLFAAVLSLAIGPTGISLQSLPRAIAASFGYANDAAADVGHAVTSSR